MKSNLTLGDTRKAVLEETLEIVSTMWAGFDAARDVETAITENTQSLLGESLPERGMSPEVALGQATDVLDQSLAQSRPRFLAYIGSSGLEIGAVADFLAASYDINMAVDARAASTLEVQTSRWLGEFIGYSNARGLFTSGGTISNITALAAARHRAQPSSRELGITTPMAVYCSAEAHYSNKRAVELLGLGSRAVRSIPIDDHHRMIPAALEAQILDDVAHGIQPMAIIARARDVPSVSSARMKARFDSSASSSRCSSSRAVCLTISAAATRSLRRVMCIRSNSALWLSHS